MAAPDDPSPSGEPTAPSTPARSRDGSPSGSDASEKVRLVLSDVDGTLVTPVKVLTPASVDAVGRLHEAGIHFAVTSGRPPRGMSMLVEPLGLRTPLSAFNGGAIVTPEMEVVTTRVVPEHAVGGIIDLIGRHGLDAWVYSGTEWYLLDDEGPHVDTESATVGFAPTAVASLDGIDEVVKVVGVGDDHDAVARAETDARRQFGDHVSAARSQPYYLDVTHPLANKGAVAQWLAQRFGLPTAAIATIGDMPNDVLMFAHSGLGIAMGNASPEVQRAARRVTTSNDDDGFANAMDRYVL